MFASACLVSENCVHADFSTNTHPVLVSPQTGFRMRVFMYDLLTGIYSDVRGVSIPLPGLLFITFLQG